MKIPRKQSDIKVKTYLEYEKFINELNDTDKSNDKLVLMKTIMMFYEIDEKKYNSLKYNMVMDMYEIIINILQMPPKLIETFLIDGIEYGINPNFDDMTFAEIVDCDTTDTIKQIAILYRPIIKRKNSKYIIKEYEADISHYEWLKENLTLDILKGFIGFFLKIQKGFILYTQKSLMEMDIEASKTNILVKSGAGIVGFMNYVEETLLNKMKSYR